MILLNGAAGKTGRAILAALVDDEQSVRCLARRAEQVARLEELGARQVVVGDMRDPGVARRACGGARAIYHLAPNLHPEEVEIGRTMLAAARDAGVELFVYHSVLHPQTEGMPHHWRKLRVEEMLLESGLPFTILQPAAYMQNVQAAWSSIREQGIYPVPYAAETRTSLVDLADVAEVARKVLTEPGHEHATYQLSSPDALSPLDIARILTQVLEREVRVEVIPREVWRDRARASGLDDERIATLRKMFDYYADYGFRGSPRVLEWLLGRPPTRFVDYARRIGSERE